MSRSGPAAVVRDVAAVARERRLGVAAAGLAYHAFNALVPLVILSLVGASLVDALEPALEAIARGTGLEAAAADADVGELAGDGHGRTRAAVLAAGILLWSAARLFRAVNTAFTDVYGARKEQSYADAIATVTAVTALNGVLLTATVAVGVVLAGLVGVRLPVASDGLATALLSPLLLSGLLFALFFPTYYLLPHPDVSVREAIPGTALAAGGWAVLAVAVRLYVTTADSVALFGVAGAILLVLTWVYLGGLCLLLGAVLNAVLADRVDPETEWVPLREVWSEHA